MDRRMVLAGGSALVLSACAPASMTAPEAEAPFDGARIMVWTSGQGRDLVLIPGLSSHPEIWDDLVARLGAGYRVHRVHVRGFAGLDAGDNASGLVAAPVAEAIADYLTFSGIPSAAVIGHSMGGQIALKMAADAPGRIGRVMVVDSSPFFPSLINARATTADVAPLAEVVRTAVLFLGDQVLRQQAGAVGERLGGAADAVVGAMGWQGGDRRVLAQGIYEVMTTDLRADLARVTAPVTVVYGWSESADSPRHQVDQGFRQSFLRLRNAARFERIEGAQHMVMIDRPREFLAAVNRFLAP